MRKVGGLNLMSTFCVTDTPASTARCEEADVNRGGAKVSII